MPQPPPKLHSPKNTLRKGPHQNNAETLFQFQSDGSYNNRDNYNRGRDNFGTLRSHQVNTMWLFWKIAPVYYLIVRLLSLDELCFSLYYPINNRRFSWNALRWKCCVKFENNYSFHQNVICLLEGKFLKERDQLWNLRHFWKIFIEWKTVGN